MIEERGLGGCDTPKVFDLSEELEDEENVKVGELQPIFSDSLVSIGWINLWGDEELKKLVVETGEQNTLPESGYKCSMNLVGCLKDGTTFEDIEPLNIQIGDAEVVIGIDLVLLSMNVGEQALVQVSPRLGYGSLGRYPDVPPNEVLIYLVKLLAAEPEQDLSTYTTSELKTIGARKRERGNWWYARDEPAIALGCYTSALEYLGADNRRLENSSSEMDELEEDRLKVYNNMAAIYLKTGKNDFALEAIEYVLSRQPYNVKALYRKGKILVALARHADALEVLSLAMEIEPENTDVRNVANEILNVMKTETPEAKKLHKEMFGSDIEIAIGAAFTETVNPETVLNKAANNETANNEKGSNEKGNNETANNEKDSNEKGNNETANNEKGNNETVNNENGNNETVNNETGTNATVNNETANNEKGNNETVNNETVNNATGNKEFVKKDAASTETLPNTPKTNKAKTKSALNLKEAKESKVSESRFGIVGVFAFIAIGAGLVAYRYKNNSGF